MSFARDCKPVLAVRGAGGSAGFFDCDADGDAAFVFADATSLLLGDECELSDFAEAAADSGIGGEPSFNGAWVAFVLSFAASAPASGLAGISGIGDVAAV